MNIDKIKTDPNINLKSNGIFVNTKLPFLYQRRMVLMNLVRPRMINGDDVGLGKTLETLAYFSYLKAANPEYKMVVFTEKNAFRQWIKEIQWLTPTLTHKIITAETHVDPSKRARAFREHNCDIIVTGYWSIYDYSQYIAQGMGKTWLFAPDEPNYFKNPMSLLHKVTYGMVVGGLDQKPYRVFREKDEDGKYKDVYSPMEKCHLPSRGVGLTATIIENRLEEAFGIMRIVAPGCLPDQRQFEKDYCIVKKTRHRGRKIVSGYKNLDKFRKQIEPYFFGRLQDDPEVLQDLPEVITKDIEIELHPAQSRKVVEAMDRLIEMPDATVKQLDVLSSLTKQQQLVNNPKILGFDLPSRKEEALLEMLQNSLLGQRVIIFSKFRHQIDLLEKMFADNKMPTVRITGKEKQFQRDEAQDRFMSDGVDHIPILLTTRAGSKAMNLQKGGHLFFFDMPWSYGTYRQMIGRLKRTGSTFKKVGVYRFIGVLHATVAAAYGTESTIDGYTLRVVMKKFKLHQAVTGDVETVDSITSEIMDVWDQIKISKKLGLTP